MKKGTVSSFYSTIIFTHQNEAQKRNKCNDFRCISLTSYAQRAGDLLCETARLESSRSTSFLTTLKNKEEKTGINCRVEFCELCAIKSLEKLVNYEELS